MLSERTIDLYARVNILDGGSVRLPRGSLDNAITLDNDPISRARTWREQGADAIHVVDLDAAANGDYRNRDLIDRLIKAVDGPVQVAGGVRSHVEAGRLIDAGAWRVVMGTAAIEDQNMVWDLCRDYPDKIVVSLDVRSNEEIATRGWTKNSGRFLEEVLVEMSSAGAVSFLIAEAGRDALIEPPDKKILATALRTVDEPVIASGGVRNLDDLREVLSIEENGRTLGGIVVGREVTHGRFTLAEAKATIDAGPLPKAAEPATGPVIEPAPSPAQVDQIARYRLLAAELEKGGSHARTAAKRIKEGNQPRDAAHGFAVRGHLVRAEEILDEIAAEHADRSEA
ncbi:MAG TPA: HisA/HisF-related TIM barrel protein [Acidimicrobiia bacterium]|nr:HisA/HisF-related TIM barrel protein [Acidimicrobiia bacterium]